ncbi:bifunctional phosphoribosylaminoimidazolecarboxamide formyltransferase/IMP cyclohydrolase [bacterium]|nr:bifunctional phosphoribosylaminoimidazolecarboxamide formyltransferase/IMP cyclohydrolase [bacterium]
MGDTSSQRAVRRALLSVSDKTGIVDLARGLIGHGVEILSTGGTARALREAGLAVTDVAEVTGFPEIMAGRVKTLHPAIHGGILGRRGTDDAVMAEHGITGIDLVVLNLYPFEQTIAKPGVADADAIENIDIGGPAMLRAAAKNHADVAVVIDPADYDAVLNAIADGGTDLALRRRLATKAFALTARYDGAIAAYLSSTQAQDPLPGTVTVQMQRHSVLRYGENPHQDAAFYTEASPPAGSIAAAKVLQGKALSFNNIADTDAAISCVQAFGGTTPACVIVKHANPCGVAVADTALAAYERAFETDSTSAFGGIIAFNMPLDGETAAAIVERQFVEVIAAPAISDEARTAIATKKNVRLLQTGMPARSSTALDYKRVAGGLLIQTADSAGNAGDWRVAGAHAPSDAQRADLAFAWTVARFVKSNAIVYAHAAQTVGIGAGQMSRVDSAKLGIDKAGAAGLQIAGSVMASDAFFPFRDSVDFAAEAGVSAIIQPGGSIRDDEVIAAADEHGIAMLLTGRRHFRH